jgi:hypothetical protein
VHDSTPPKPNDSKSRRDSEERDYKQVVQKRDEVFYQEKRAVG